MCILTYGVIFFTSSCRIFNVCAIPLWNVSEELVSINKSLKFRTMDVLDGLFQAVCMGGAFTDMVTTSCIFCKENKQFVRSFIPYKPTVRANIPELLKWTVGMLISLPETFCKIDRSSEMVLLSST